MEAENNDSPSTLQQYLGFTTTRKRFEPGARFSGERPGNLTGPKSYFEIKISRKVGRVLTSNEVHFVSPADTFTVQFSNLLKLPSGMENKIA